ncbi:uncharacterized protein LOC142483196 [Ascaphus truei]|uniref:uncharacterized protein LOC142483196 n=1 Tax=Ascaphus truei TaxID=8439 RepID=UPI003F5A1730
MAVTKGRSRFKPATPHNLSCFKTAIHQGRSQFKPAAQEEASFLIQRPSWCTQRSQRNVSRQRLSPGWDRPWRAHARKHRIRRDHQAADPFRSRLQVRVQERSAGCAVTPTLTLSHVTETAGVSRTGSALFCRLCPGTEVRHQRNVTFRWSLDGVLRGTRPGQQSALFYLHPTSRKNHGRWRCEVEEQPNVTAEYDLGPPTPNPVTETEVDTGCPVTPTLALNLIPAHFTTGSALFCRLCPGTEVQHRRNVTFRWSLNGVHRGTKLGPQRVLFPLDPTSRKNHGRWRCEVEEYPNVTAEYDLEPPTPTPVTETEVDTDTKNASLTTIFVIIIVAVSFVTLVSVAICHFIGQCKKASDPLQLEKDGHSSDNCPLKENLSVEPYNPYTEMAADVCYVELELVQHSSPRLPTSPRTTVYASIM